MPEMDTIDASRSLVPGIDIVEADARSVASPTHPEQNQDACFVAADHRIAAVFDGLGGEAGGELASDLGVRMVERRAAALDEWAHDWPRRVLDDARLDLRALRLSHPRLRACGATAVVAAVVGERVEVAWCGDARAYAIDTAHCLVKLTRDHSLATDGLSDPAAARLDAILDEANGPSDAWRRGGAAAKRAFRQRHMVAAELGDGRISTLSVSRHDFLAIVLTSDGVHDNLTTTTIAALVAEGDLKTLASRLVAAAVAYSRAGEPRSKPDDVTAVVLPLQPPSASLHSSDV